MKIRQATSADLPEVMRVFTSAKLSLKRMGIDQWQYPGVPDTSKFPLDIEAGRAYVVAADEGAPHLVGFMTLTPGPDPVYEHIEGPGWNYPNQPYFSVHRLAVDSMTAGQGVGTCMLRFAQHKAALNSADGVDWHIRLDTHPGNRRMLRLFNALRFRYAGIAMYDIPGERRRLCYDAPGRFSTCKVDFEM